MAVTTDPFSRMSPCVRGAPSPIYFFVNTKLLPW